MPTKYTIEDAPAQSKYTIEDTHSPAQTAPNMGDLRAPTDRERFSDPNFYPVGAPGEGVGDNLKNLAQRGGVGIFQLFDALTHPRQTVAGMLSSVVPDPVVRGANKVVDLENKIPGMHYLTTKLPEGTDNPLHAGYQAVAPGGLQAAANVAPAVGQVLATAGLGEMVPKVAADTVRGGKTVLRNGANIIAGTGPKVAEDLATKTAEVNKGAAEATAKANQKALDDYHASLAKTQADQLAAQDKHAATVATKADSLQTKEQTEAAGIAHQHQQAVDDAQGFNDRVNAKHAAAVDEAKQHNEALNHMLDRRNQMQAKLDQDTQAYYDLEDAKKAEAKAQENAAWQPWRQKMEAATIDGGEIAKALKKVAGNSPEVTRQLRQLQASPADAAPDSLYAQDRAAIMKSQGYTGDYFDYPENIRSKIDQIAQSSGFEPDPIDFDPEAGKPISIEAVHRAHSILQQYIRSGRYEGPLLGEMKQVAKTLRAAITRASMDAGAGPELEAARQATIKYQEAFGRERHLPTTHDEIREKQANPEAFKERNDEERLQGASTVAPELTDAYRNVKSQRDALKSFPTEDALRKQIKQTPEPPTVGDLRPGYNLKETPTPPRPQLTSGTPRERAMKAVGPVEPPQYPAVPPVKIADVKKIGLQDIRDAKADKITSQKGPVGGGFGHIAAGAGGWHLIHSAMMGNPEGMVTGGALAATPYVLAKVLKNPSVVRLLSEPTPADIAAIPPELRGDLPALVKAAQAQGIKVHPAFVVMAGATNAPQQ